MPYEARSVVAAEVEALAEFAKRSNQNSWSAKDARERRDQERTKTMRVKQKNGFVVQRLVVAISTYSTELLGFVFEVPKFV
jgi:hypothetical protein